MLLYNNIMRWDVNLYYPLTSSISKAKVGESPDVTEPYCVTDHGE